MWIVCWIFTENPEFDKKDVQKNLASAAAMIGALCLSYTYVKGQDDAKVTV